MSVVFLIIIGAAAGLVATRAMKLDVNLVATIAIGIAGALVGGWVLRALLSVMGILAGFVGAVIGAIFLIWLWQKLQQR